MELFISVIAALLAAVMVTSLLSQTIWPSLLIGMPVGLIVGGVTYLILKSM